MPHSKKLQHQKKWLDGPAIKVVFHLSDQMVEKIDLTPSGKQGMDLEICSECRCEEIDGKIMRWMDQYAQGMQPEGLIPLNLHQLPSFTRDVLFIMQRIPFGTVCSYGDVARMLGAPKSARAVGGACRRNPFPLVVPCHRVIDSGKNLRGYSAGGIEVKKVLLDFEEVII
jgi:methylated-DNA-[protein]-cysteine S-methyltransferase